MKSIMIVYVCIYMALNITYHHHHHHYPRLDYEFLRVRVVSLFIHCSTTIHSGLTVYQPCSGCWGFGRDKAVKVPKLLEFTFY